MLLSLGITIQATSVRQAPITGRVYEFDNKYWNVNDMRWDMINDTWEEEI